MARNRVTGTNRHRATRRDRQRYEAQIPANPRIRDPRPGDYRVTTVPGIGTGREVHHQIYNAFAWQTVCTENPIGGCHWIDGIAQEYVQFFPETIFQIETATDMPCPRLAEGIVLPTRLLTERVSETRTMEPIDDSDADGQRGTRGWLHEAMTEMMERQPHRHGILPHDFPQIPDLGEPGEVRRMSAIPNPRIDLSNPFSARASRNDEPLTAAERAEIQSAIATIHAGMTDDERERTTAALEVRDPPNPGGEPGYMFARTESEGLADSPQQAPPGPGDPGRLVPGPLDPLREVPGRVHSIGSGHPRSRIDAQIDRDYDLRRRVHMLNVRINIDASLVEENAAARGFQPLIDSLSTQAAVTMRVSVRLRLLADALETLENCEPGFEPDTNPALERARIGTDGTGKRDVDL